MRIKLVPRISSRNVFIQNVQEYLGNERIQRTEDPLAKMKLPSGHSPMKNGIKTRIFVLFYESVPRI